MHPLIVAGTDAALTAKSINIVPQDPLTPGSTVTFVDTEVTVSPPLTPRTTPVLPDKIPARRWYRLPLEEPDGRERGPRPRFRLRLPSPGEQ
jgi:hypothetical protein